MIEQQQSKNQSPSRFLVALFGYLLCLLIATFGIPEAWLPLEVLPSIITAKPYVLRNEKSLYDREDVQTALIGSSLVLKPSLECDRVFENQKVPLEQAQFRAFKQSYRQSLHLGRLLKAKIKDVGPITNFGVPACMVSDYYLILSKFQDFAKRPQLIVLCVREFLDNSYPDPKQTASYRLMSNCRPSERWLGHPAAAATFVLHHFLPFAVLSDAIDTVKGRGFSYRYDWENKLKMPVHWLEDRYSGIFLSPGPTMNQCNSDLPKKENKKRYFDLEAYRWCYDPPDLEHFGRQFQYFEKFVNLTNKWKIPLVVVDMPITPENQALISPSVLSLYKQALQANAKKYNFVLVDANKLSACNDLDFVDSTHLNASGGHKCFTCIADTIAHNSQLCEKLCSSKSAIQM